MHFRVLRFALKAQLHQCRSDGNPIRKSFPLTPGAVLNNGRTNKKLFKLAISCRSESKLIFFILPDESAKIKSYVWCMCCLSCFEMRKHVLQLLVLRSEFTSSEYIERIHRASSSQNGSVLDSSPYLPISQHLGARLELFASLISEIRSGSHSLAKHSQKAAMRAARAWIRSVD